MTRQLERCWCVSVITPNGSKSPLCPVQVFRDGTGRVVTASADNDLRVWKRPAKGHLWTCDAVLKGHTKGLTSVALDPRNKCVAERWPILFLPQCLTFARVMCVADAVAFIHRRTMAQFVRGSTDKM